MTRSDPLDRLLAALERDFAPSSDFDLNPDVTLPIGRALREAAVLIAISLANETPRVILTKRASGMKHHPGQIAFPGGKRDPGDVDLVQTALREASEEIALPPSMVEIKAVLPAHETVTAFTVSPVLGLIRDEFSSRPEQGEVAEVFSVPLAHLLDPGNFIVEGRRWRGTRRHYYAVPYGPYYIWGATARILRSLAEQAAQ